MSQLYIVSIEGKQYAICGEWIDLGRRGKEKRRFSPRYISEKQSDGIVPMPSVEQEVIYFNHHKEIESQIPDERPNDDVSTGEQAVPRPSGRTTGASGESDRRKAHKSESTKNPHKSRRRVTKRTVQWARSGPATGAQRVVGKEDR